MLEACIFGVLRTDIVRSGESAKVIVKMAVSVVREGHYCQSLLGHVESTVHVSSRLIRVCEKDGVSLMVREGSGISTLIIIKASLHEEASNEVTNDVAETVQTVNFNVAYLDSSSTRK